MAEIRPEPAELSILKDELKAQVTQTSIWRHTATVTVIAACVLVALSVYVLDQRIDRLRAKFDSEIAFASDDLAEMQQRLELIDPDVLDQILALMAQQERRSLTNEARLNQLQKVGARM